MPKRACLVMSMSMCMVRLTDFHLASHSWLSMHILVVHLPSASGSATVLCLDFGCSRMRGAVPGVDVIACTK